MIALLGLHLHNVDPEVFAVHLLFDGAATAGGYYARGFCKHLWHRVAIAAAWSMITTYMLISLVG